MLVYNDPKRLALAKTWISPDGEITIYMHQYQTTGEIITADYLAALMPRSEWRLLHLTFLILETSVLWLEFADTLSAERTALKYYRDSRKDNSTGAAIGHNWDLFTSTIGVQSFNDIWAAHAAIRVSADSKAPMPPAKKPRQRKPATAKG